MATMNERMAATEATNSAQNKQLGRLETKTDRLISKFDDFKNLLIGQLIATILAIGGIVATLLTINGG